MSLNARKPDIVACNKKVADQPAHPHSLISAFVIRLLESIKSRLAMSKISIFSLGDWFESRFVGNRVDRFSRIMANMLYFNSEENRS